MAPCRDSRHRRNRNHAVFSSLDPTVDSGNRLAIASSHICNGLPDAPLLRWTPYTYNSRLDGDGSVRAAM